MLLSPGSRVDRYEVQDLLGSGGMGDVYRARDPKLARFVALKILRADSGAGTEGHARLMREARAVAALTHPNVLAIYDVGEVTEPAALRGTSYIAMELVLGRSLRSYLGDGSIPLPMRVTWLRDVALALGAAHATGIVHRDVKPENVMVREDGVVKVLDFGIARRAGATNERFGSQIHDLATMDTDLPLPTLTGEGRIVGTPYYMAPEQLRGESIDARADQFGWAVVAYLLLTGKAPWGSPDEPLVALSQMLTYEPPSPASIDASIPPALSSVITRALAKRREDRFPSMTELVASLDAGVVVPRLATPTPIEPAQVSTGTGERASQEAPSATGRAYLVAGAALLVAAGALLLRPNSHPKAPRTASSAAATAGECNTNRDCVRAHGGEPWHCHTDRHVCAAVSSPDCTVYAGSHDAEADDVVWIGGMLPLRDHDFDSESRAPELARQDFAGELAFGEARTGTLHARPIGLVLCDEAADAVGAAHHLVDDVEVPAVLGFRSQATARTTLSSVFLPARVLSMVTLSQGPAVTRIPEPPDGPRLVWRTTLDRDAAAVPLAKLVSEVVEPALRAAPRGIGQEPIRVAAVCDSKDNHDFVDALFDALHFNGKSALANGADFRQFVLGGADGGESLARDLSTFAPHVVIASTFAFFDDVLPRLEAALGRGAPRPVYLTESSIPSSAGAFVGRDADRRRRFFAVTNVSDTPNNAKLVLRYNVAFPREPIARTEAPQPSYDAFYLVAYAIYALGDQPVTGPALAEAFARLGPPGPHIDVGPGGILEGFQRVRSGGRIDLQGAIGSLDLDPSTGEAPIDYGIVCLGLDDHGRAGATVDSGLVYDATARRLVGALRCP